MKRRVKVIFPDREVHWWNLTTEHSQSSYNLPVLVDTHNQAFGPADLPPGTIIRIASKDLLIAEGAKMAGYSIET